MKIRLGFVSNSSSTSFTIYGIVLTEAEKNNLDIMDDAPYDLYHYGDPNGDSMLYLGEDIDTMEMDETKKQWQEKVAKKLSEILGRDVSKECATHSESYYDG